MIYLLIGTFIFGVLFGLFIGFLIYKPYSEKLWIARDYDSEINIFITKPTHEDGYFKRSNEKEWKGTLPQESFTNIIWENSPIKVSIKTIKYYG